MPAKNEVGVWGENTNGPAVQRPSIPQPFCLAQQTSAHQTRMFTESSPLWSPKPLPSTSSFAFNEMVVRVRGWALVASPSGSLPSIQISNFSCQSVYMNLSGRAQPEEPRGGRGKFLSPDLSLQFGLTNSTELILFILKIYVLSLP